MMPDYEFSYARLYYPGQQSSWMTGEHGVSSFSAKDDEDAIAQAKGCLVVAENEKSVTEEGRVARKVPVKLVRIVPVADWRL